MRLDELRLLAFGPFTNEVLDLRGGAPGGLHVIYGPNEAGKSTSLRAVVNFLFGMPRRSPDAHLHPSARLAVGAVISGNGKTFELTRLKRNREDLVDEHGTPLPTNPLAELLGYLDQASFCTRFGLDQAELEKGAEALLGGSEQGLFAAGTAGADARRVLRQLDEQAAELFLPRGRLPLLNRYNAEYEQSLAEARRAERPVEKWIAQKRSYEQAQAEVARIEQRRAQVRNELRRLQRLKAVLSDLLEWQAASARMKALVDVPELPEDALRERIDVSSQLTELQAEARRVVQDLTTFEQELSQLREPSALADIDDEQLQLAARVGTAISARKDLPKRQAALAEQRRVLALLLQDLGHDVTAGSELALARDVLLRAEGTRVIGRLIAQHSGLASRLEAAEARLRRLNARPGGQDAPVTHPGVSLVVLEGLMAEAKFAQHTSSEIIQEEKARGQKATRIEQLRSVLRCSTSWQNLAQRLPHADTIRALIQEHQTAHEELLARRRARQEIEGRLQSGVEQLKEDEGLPSLEALRTLRERRDHAIAQYQGQTANERELLLFMVHQTDAAADELLAQADQVYARQSLLRQHRELEVQLEKAVRAEERATELERGCWQAFSSLALDLGATPPSAVARVQAWYEELRALVTLEVEHQELTRGLEERRASVTRVEEKLRDGLSDDARGLDLIGLLALLDSAMRRAVQAHERAAQLESNRRSLQSEREGAVLELDEARLNLQAWTQAWSRSLAPLGLAETTSVERAQEVLTTLSRVERVVEIASNLENRITGMERDTDALDRDIGRYVLQFLPQGPADEETVDRALRLLEAIRVARRDRDEWLRVSSLVDERRATLMAVQARCEGARQRLKSMMTFANVDDEQGLVEVEQLAAEKRQLRARLQELSERIRISSDGAPLEELIVEAEQWGGAVRRLIVRIDDLEQEGSDLEDELRQAQSDAESRRLGLLAYQTEDVAVARQVASERAAVARSTLRKYLVLKAAHTLLEEQITRYAERFSGPITERASALFSRITLGKYSRLSVGLGERTLRCVRGGHEVEVAELSRGARAQLYFVLRLASLERYFSEHPKVPLVFDDLFVDFDDDRATVAFELLADLAKSVQILYFTHLARDVEKAHDAVPRERLFTHAIGVT